MRSSPVTPMTGISVGASVPFERVRGSMSSSARTGLASSSLRILVDELQARKLQQADRLLELGSHDKLLTEPELLLDLHAFDSSRRPPIGESTLSPAAKVA